MSTANVFELCNEKKFERNRLTNEEEISGRYKRIHCGIFHTSMHVVQSLPHRLSCSLSIERCFSVWSFNSCSLYHTAHTCTHRRLQGLMDNRELRTLLWVENIANLYFTSRICICRSLRMTNMKVEHVSKTLPEELSSLDSFDKFAQKGHTIQLVAHQSKYAARSRVSTSLIWPNGLGKGPLRSIISNISLSCWSACNFSAIEGRSL